MGRRAHHRPSPLWLALTGVAALQLIMAGSALAAEPPADIVLDGVVTVRFVAEADATPLADATVTVEASRPAIDPEPFQSLTGTTDADGVVAIAGVARPADGAPAVSLAIRATTTRPNDCGGSETFDGGTTVDAAATVSVDVIGSAASSCVAFPIVGMVVDANGEPFAVADAVATIRYPGAEPETEAVEVADDGSFAILLRGWAGQGSTEVQLLVIGESRQVPGDDGCTDVVADLADVSWTLDVPEAPDPSLVLALPTLVGSVCDGAPGTPAPTVTLPPTDAAPDATTPSPSLGNSPLPVLLVVGAAAVLAVASARSLNRRGN